MEINYNYEITDVKTEDIILFGNRGNLRITGILNGSVIVKAPSSLHVEGIMNGDLVIEEGASAEIRGILKSNSILCAGTMDVHGIVTCVNTIRGDVAFHRGCIVNGIEY